MLVELYAGNYNTNDGLVNGAEGIFKFYSSNDVVWIEFSCTDIGKEQRNKYKELYETNILPSWTPILRIAKPLAMSNNKLEMTIRKQFPIQLACARTIHRTQGLTLDKLAFDPTGMTQHGLVYTALSRVKTIDSLYLLSKLSHKNFHVKDKVLNEMTRLTTIATWELKFGKKISNNKNVLSIATLNTRSLYAHISDVVHHTDLMDNMILCFQETHLQAPPTNKQFFAFNFAIAHCIHGILTCIEKKITIQATKTFCNNKTELTLTDMYFQQPICLINIYAAPFEQVSTIIQMIRDAKSQTTHTNCIFLVIGDLNIDIQQQTTRTRTFVQYMETENLQEITSKLSPRRNTVIDHIWTNLPIEQCEINVSWAYWSDHSIFYALLQL